MFYIFSKILFVFSQPIFWLLGLLIWAFRSKNEAKRRRILGGCLFLLLFLTNPFLSHRVFDFYENQVKSVDMSSGKTYDVGIVLGGFSYLKGRALRKGEPLPFNVASNRLTDALFYLKTGRIKKILISGGDGRLGLKHEDLSEARLTRDYLLALGVADSCILVEPNSRNTHENALFSATLLDSLGMKKGKILLITSALHMKRAAGCFWKQGVSFDCCATSYQAKPLIWNAESTIIPDERGFELWQFWVREQLGVLAYWCSGRI